MEDNLEIDTSENILLHSGFPNPAISQMNKPLALDLNHLLIKRPSSSFIFRISGHAYSDQGIYDNDLIIVDRALNAAQTDLVVVWQDSFKLIRRHLLEPDSSLWGTVKAVVHELR